MDYDGHVVGFFCVYIYLRKMCKCLITICWILFMSALMMHLESFELFKEPCCRSMHCTSNSRGGHYEGVHSPSMLVKGFYKWVVFFVFSLD